MRDSAVLPIVIHPKAQPTPSAALVDTRYDVLCLTHNFQIIANRRTDPILFLTQRCRSCSISWKRGTNSLEYYERSVDHMIAYARSELTPKTYFRLREEDDDFAKSKGVETMQELSERNEREKKTAEKSEQSSGSRSKGGSESRDSRASLESLDEVVFETPAAMWARVDSGIHVSAWEAKDW